MDNEQMAINSTNRVIHRFIQEISAYEPGGEFYSQIIPLDTQAYAIYSNREENRFFYVIGDGEHTYTEIRDGKGNGEAYKEYPVLTKNNLNVIVNGVEEEVKERKAADELLQAQIDDEENIRKQIDEYLQQQIDENDEFISELQRNLTKEIDERKHFDELLDEALGEEIQNRETADVNLQNTIDAEKDRALVQEGLLNDKIIAEIQDRENADTNLQSQIDAITVSSDVTDVVGTYAQLQSYNTSSLAPNSVIKVLKDESRDDGITYYRWVIENEVGSWYLIGEEGPYYTKSEANTTFVPQIRTINGKALSANVTLSAGDVGADSFGSAMIAEQNAKTYADSLANNYATAAQGQIADTAVQPEDLSTVATSGDYDDLVNKPVNISEFTNDANYVTESQLETKQDILVSGTNIKTVNNQSLLGSGNIEIEGGSSTAEEIINANEATGATNPLSIWQGTEQEYNQYEMTSWKNWKTDTNVSQTSTALLSRPIMLVDKKECYTLDSEPTTSSVIYSEPSVESPLTVTTVGVGSITLSDGHTYNRNSGSDVDTYRNVGEVHPDYICNINNVGVKIGNTLIADATDTSGLQPILTAGASMSIVGNTISTTATTLHKVTNTTVQVSEFIADSQYTDYNYRADITVTGITANDYPTVIFSPEDSISNNFARFVESGDGYVSIWSKEVPESPITIPVITFE